VSRTLDVPSVFVPDRRQACASSPASSYAGALRVVRQTGADTAWQQNHSCLPNCKFSEHLEASNSVPTVYVRATKASKAGKQLTLLYGDGIPGNMRKKRVGLRTIRCLCSAEGCRRYVFG
jgi:hypothetical protein